ncbi:MAG: class D sortase [Acidimicrobiales bacterium]
MRLKRHGQHSPRHSVQPKTAGTERTDTYSPARPSKRRTGAALVAIGVTAFVGSGAILTSIAAYKSHVAAAAHHLSVGLAHAEAAAERPAAPGRAATCDAPPPSSPMAGSGARMLLTAPTIGLDAPVNATSSESALNTGVGHLPTSAWPDQGGTVVLEAHDVTFFANLSKLHAGSTITLQAPCRTWTYRVSSANVVVAGTPVPATSAPTLVLVTCWPTNALYFTDHRYVVTAQLAAAETARSVIAAPVSYRVPSYTLPAGVSAEAVSVSTIGVPEGTLEVSSRLTPALRASAATLEATHAATTVFDTGLVAAEDGQAAWWDLEAPGIPFAESAALRDAHITWESPLQISLSGTDTTFTAAHLEDQVNVGGVAYHLHVDLGVQRGRWVIIAWSMPNGP